MKRQSYLGLMWSRDKDFRVAVILAAAVPLSALVFAVTVGSHPDFFGHLFPPCALKFFTGYNCLSCGATRATLALLRGDLLTAIWYNPLYILFLGWLGYLYVRLMISLIRRPYRKYSLHISVPWGVSTAILVILFLIIRNTPFYQAIFY